MTQCQQNVPQHNQFTFCLPDHNIVTFSSRFDSGNCGSVRMASQGKEFIIEPYPDIDTSKQTQGWCKSWFHFSVSGLTQKTTFHILRLKMLYNLFSAYFFKNNSESSYRPVYRIEENGKAQRLQTPVKLDYDEKENTLKLSFSFDFSTLEDKSQSLDQKEISRVKNDAETSKKGEKNDVRISLEKKTLLNSSQRNHFYQKANSLSQLPNIQPKIQRRHSLQSDCLARDSISSRNINLYNCYRLEQAYAKPINIQSMAYSLPTSQNLLKKKLIFEKKTVYFSFSYPYSYKQSQQFVQEMSKKYLNDPDIYFNKEILTHSPQMRSIDILTISSNDSLSGDRESYISDMLFPERHKESRAFKFKSSKPVILISARVHPGETPASFALEGMVKFLLDKEDLRSYLLRKFFTFWIVPMLNPDGVYNGHYRMDVYNQNLNRYYQIANNIKQPSIYAMKKIISLLSLQNRLFFYIDLHAHAGKKGSFLYGNAIDEFSLQVENQVFAKLMAANDPSFEPAFCNFSKAQMKAKDKQEELTKQGCGRVFAYQQSKIIHSYTLECGFHHASANNQLQPCQNSQFEVFISNDLYFLKESESDLSQNSIREPYDFLTPQHFAVTGKSVLLSILDTYEKNPYSRIPTGQMDIIRRETAIELARSERVRMEDAQSYSKAKNIAQLLHDSFFSKIQQMKLFSLPEHIPWPSSIKIQMVYKHTGIQILNNNHSPVKRKKKIAKKITSAMQQDLQQFDNQQIKQDEEGTEKQMHNIIQSEKEDINISFSSKEGDKQNEKYKIEIESQEKFDKRDVMVWTNFDKNNNYNVINAHKSHLKIGSLELDFNPKDNFKHMSKFQIHQQEISQKQKNSKNKSCSAENHRNKLIGSQLQQQPISKHIQRDSLKNEAQELSKVLYSQPRRSIFQAITIKNPFQTLQKQNKNRNMNLLELLSQDNFEQTDNLKKEQEKIKEDFLVIPPFQITSNSPHSSLVPIANDQYKLQIAGLNQSPLIERIKAKKGCSVLRELVSKVKQQPGAPNYHVHAFQDRAIFRNQPSIHQQNSNIHSLTIGEHVDPLEIKLSSANRTPSKKIQSVYKTDNYKTGGTFKKQPQTRCLSPLDRVAFKDETNFYLTKNLMPLLEKRPLHPSERNSFLLNQMVPQRSSLEFADKCLEKILPERNYTSKILRDGFETLSSSNNANETANKNVQSEMKQRKKDNFNKIEMLSSSRNHSIDQKISNNNSNHTSNIETKKQIMGKKIEKYLKYIENYSSCIDEDKEDVKERIKQNQILNSNNSYKEGYASMMEEIKSKNNEQFLQDYRNKLNEINDIQSTNNLKNKIFNRGRSESTTQVTQNNINKNNIIKNNINNKHGSCLVSIQDLSQTQIQDLQSKVIFQHNSHEVESIVSRSCDSNHHIHAYHQKNQFKHMSQAHPIPDSQQIIINVQSKQQPIIDASKQQSNPQSKRENNFKQSSPLHYLPFQEMPSNIQPQQIQKRFNNNSKIKKMKLPYLLIM